ncbi:MAG: glycogen/starch synthase [Oscillospiraceae bacterium]
MNAELERLMLLKGHSRLPHILIAAAECTPLSKTGGLADVAGALPKSLNALGFDARVITPYHRCIKEKYAHRVQHLCEFQVHLGWRSQYAGLEKLELDGLVVYLIDNEYYFGDKIYRGGLAEGEQYAYFQRAVLEAIPLLDFQPQVLHCNDWHTAMIPFLIKTQYAGRPQGGLKTVLTIHNIAFQGKFGFDFVGDMLGVDSGWYRPDGIEHYGCANFLKAGCLFADRVNTVSPSYADEIRTPQFGEGLQDVLISRGGDLSGILNGLDTGFFDPETDPELACRFSADAPEGKAANKAALLRELGLDVSEDTPVIAMVTRMTSQKGFDLVLRALDDIMDTGACFLLLGSGDARYEGAMRGYEEAYKGRLCAYLGYSEPLAHRIYAGADFLLMPSAFEPCGLSQMIAMRYGTLPIVHEVGGLRDTVIPYNRFTGEGNGFSFGDFSPETLLNTVRFALDTYRDGEAMARLRRAAMSGDYSFGPSAVEYGRLFLSVLPDGGSGFFHDPFDEDFRAPLGAVKCGTTVRLRLRSESYQGGAELAVGDRLYPMTWEDGFYRADFPAPEEPGVLWYSFRLAFGLSFGAEGLSSGSARPWQLTVYAADFETPTWAEGAVMYQIFPDRWRRAGAAPQKGAAYHRKLGRKIEMHKSWDEPVKWSEPDGSDYDPNDFYGGTLSGIAESLPELYELGVRCLYLNPIFESASNHRYNTSDYRKIDPILGTEAAFKKLCAAAKELGMHIVLDGVFSHTGDDSLYFNKYGRYGGVGAYQSEDSPCHSWYDFRSFPDDYRCWWGFKTLPEVNEGDPVWQDTIITGDDSVIKKWLRCGAGGWRLDVSDELPDQVIGLMRAAVKETDPEALLLGEVWEDATTKVSYGEHRSYALGRGLDSVMNYPLRTAVTDFALGKQDAYALRDFLLGQMLNYPAPMYKCLMNLMGSHDTARLRSLLGSGTDGSGMSRGEQAAFTLTEEQNALGRARQRLCAAIQFALPGMPCVYYGDEEGMQGLRDPFCRGTYRRAEDELRDYYAALARERSASPDLLRGAAAFAAPDGDTLCILRYDSQGAHVIAVSRAAGEKRFALSAGDFRGLTYADAALLPPIPEISLAPMEAKFIKIEKE